MPDKPVPVFWQNAGFAATHCCTDRGMQQRLQQTSRYMQSRPGSAEAAQILDKLLKNLCEEQR